VAPHRMSVPHDGTRSSQWLTLVALLTRAQRAGRVWPLRNPYRSAGCATDCSQTCLRAYRNAAVRVISDLTTAFLGR
jgi:hypothetical protein